MEWKKVLWGSKGLDYYPGPNGQKLYTRWIKGDKYLLDICEDTKKTAYGHVTSFQIKLDDSIVHLIEKEMKVAEQNISAEVYTNAYNLKKVKVREMNQRELSDFCNIFSLQLEDFPLELKDTVLNDLREYFNIKNVEYI